MLVLSREKKKSRGLLQIRTEVSRNVSCAPLLSNQMLFGLKYKSWSGNRDILVLQIATLLVIRLRGADRQGCVAIVGRSDVTRSDMTRHKLFRRNLVDTNCPNRFRPQEGYDLFDNAQTHCKHRGQLSNIYDTKQKREPRTQGHSIQGQRKINKGQKLNQIDMKTDRLGQPP